MKNQVQYSTFLIALAAVFGVGFLSGVIVTTYKSPPVTTAEHDHGGSEEMIAALNEEIRQRPDNAEAWIRLGNLYFDTGRYNEAVNAYERAVELDPNNPDVWTDLGVMYRRTNQPEKAVDVFGKAVALDPDHKTARFNTGIVLLFDLDKREEALSAWKSLLKIDPLFTTPAGQSLDELIDQYSVPSG
ncbi:MAG: tetratricopeptide repeat protein [Thermodesulfobacteriota bacterium]